jgi:hypothetical protein
MSTDLQTQIIALYVDSYITNKTHDEVLNGLDFKEDGFWFVVGALARKRAKDLLTKWSDEQIPGRPNDEEGFCVAFTDHILAKVYNGPHIQTKKRLDNFIAKQLCSYVEDGAIIKSENE